MHAGGGQSSTAAAVGAAQIVAGVINIGLGSGRSSTRPGDLGSTGAAYWLGGVMAASGVVSVVAGHAPSSCLTAFAVVLNVVAAVFAVAMMALYSADLRDASLLWMCDGGGSHGDGCREVALLVQSVLTSTDVALVVLAALLLVLSVRFAVLGIGALSGGATQVEMMSDHCGNEYF